MPDEVQSRGSVAVTLYDNGGIAISTNLSHIEVLGVLQFALTSAQRATNAMLEEAERSGNGFKIHTSAGPVQ